MMMACALTGCYTPDDEPPAHEAWRQEDAGQWSPPATRQAAPPIQPISLAPEPPAAPATRPGNPTEPEPTPAQYAWPDDIVRPGDVLNVGVDLLPEQEVLKTTRVDPEGYISVFLIGRVGVGGISLRDAEKAVAQAYQSHRIVAHALVSINRTSHDTSAATQPVILRPGDWVSLRIFSDPDKAEPVTRLVRISPGGDVGIPYLGQTAIGGLTESQAEEAIVKAYADAGLIRNAMASVVRVPAPATLPADIAPAGPAVLDKQKK